MNQNLDTVAEPRAVGAEGTPVGLMGESQGPGERGSRITLPNWVGLFASNKLAVAGCVMLAIIVFACVCAPLFSSYDSTTIGTVDSSLSPSWSHPFGTNQPGEDIFAQVLWGGRFSLTVAVLAGLLTTVLATVVGMTAGYIGGWVDDVLGMVMNVFLVVPQLVLLIIITSYAPASANSLDGDASKMILVIAITGWAWGGRVLRAQTMSLKNRDYVLAAKVAGESTPRIIFAEVLPNMISLMTNTFIMSALGAIITEAGLEFLGLGDVSNITWGVMLHQAQTGASLAVGEWWDFTAPGLAIALTAAALMLINNGVDVISNPKLRTVRALRLPRRKAARSAA
jgi:peptide/nickel transport system permease protein